MQEQAIIIYYLTNFVNVPIFESEPIQNHDFLKIFSVSN